MAIKETDRWMCQMPDIDPLPVRVKKLSSTEFLFTVNYGGRGNGLLIAFQRPKRAKEFQGTFVDGGMMDGVTFKTQNRGKEIVATPQGFHCPMKWIFTKE